LFVKIHYCENDCQVAVIFNPLTTSCIGFSCILVHTRLKPFWFYNRLNHCHYMWTCFLHRSCIGMDSGYDDWSSRHSVWQWMLWVWRLLSNWLS